VQLPRRCDVPTIERAWRKWPDRLAETKATEFPRRSEMTRCANSGREQMQQCEAKITVRDPQDR
jgi:hypothetical protein